MVIKRKVFFWLAGIDKASAAAISGKKIRYDKRCCINIKSKV
jgi:hypothetical protein